MKVNLYNNKNELFSYSQKYAIMINFKLLKLYNLNEKSQSNELYSTSQSELLTSSYVKSKFSFTFQGFFTKVLNPKAY